jgi:hypothetical protein
MLLAGDFNVRCEANSDAGAAQKSRLFRQILLTGIFPAVVQLHHGAGLTDEAIARTVILRGADRLAIGVVVASVVIVTVIVRCANGCCSDRRCSAPTRIISARITRYRATGTTGNRVTRTAGTTSYQVAWMRASCKVVTASTAPMYSPGMHAAATVKPAATHTVAPMKASSRASTATPTAAATATRKRVVRNED